MVNESVKSWLTERGFADRLTEHGEIHPCSYEETDSYQVTEMFINNREQILKRLLEN